MKFLIVFALALALATASAFRIGRSGKLGIVNGKDAAARQFPYQVGLYLELGPYKASFCGGSLIGQKWVLTAAHCTEGTTSVTVYLGANKRKEAEIEHTVGPSDIIEHPDWDNQYYKNDISLIKIPATSYTDNIKAVKLPAISSSYATYEGDNVIASGWGRLSDSATESTKDLQWASFKIITNAACAKTFLFKVKPSNICISTSSGVSTCSGDSGGPLVLESSKVQIGLTSFGYRFSCEMGYPEVFTRLTSYLDWIKENTGISY